MKLRQPTNEATVKEWFRRIEDEERPANDDPRLNVYGPGKRIMAYGYTLCSYGPQFPIAVFHPKDHTYLLNISQRHSHATTRHQRLVRKYAPAHSIDIGECLYGYPYLDVIKINEHLEANIMANIDMALRARRHRAAAREIVEDSIRDRISFAETFGGEPSLYFTDIPKALVALKLAA